MTTALSQRPLTALEERIVRDLPTAANLTVADPASIAWQERVAMGLRSAGPIPRMQMQHHPPLPFGGTVRRGPTQGEPAVILVRGQVQGNLGARS